MREWFGVVVVWLVIGAAAAGAQTGPTTPPASSPAARRISVDEAVALALRESKAVRFAAEGIRKARARTGESRAAGMPAVSAGATMTHLDEGVAATFPGGDGQSHTVTLARQDQPALALQATLPVDVTGMIRTAVEAGQFLETAARLELVRVRGRVALEASVACHDLLRARAAAAVAETALTNARDRLAMAEAYERAGVGTRFEALRAQADVAGARQVQIAAQNRVAMAVASLDQALGIDQNTAVELTEAAAAEAPAGTLAAEIEAAYRDRPEIAQAEAGIRAAQRGVRLARRSMLPSVGLGWSVQYTPSPAGFSPRNTTWAAVAQVSIPLFDQGVARARVDQASAEVVQAEIGRQQALDRVALEVRQAHLEAADARERLAVAEAAAAVAREQYRLAQSRYRAGVTQSPGTSPLLEVSDAQTALTLALTNQVNARYDVRTALAHLDWATGRVSAAAGSGK